jgi:hypothetical protein
MRTLQLIIVIEIYGHNMSQIFHMICGEMVLLYNYITFVNFRSSFK